MGIAQPVGGSTWIGVDANNWEGVKRLHGTFVCNVWVVPEGYTGLEKVDVWIWGVMCRVFRLKI